MVNFWLEFTKNLLFPPENLLLTSFHMKSKVLESTHLSLDLPGNRVQFSKQLFKSAQNSGISVNSHVMCNQKYFGRLFVNVMTGHSQRFFVLHCGIHTPQCKKEKFTLETTWTKQCT